MSDTSTRAGFVVMAVHKPAPDLLRHQISSLLAQTETRWTCFIGIDGHDDRSATLVRHLVGADPRMVVREYASNVGVYRHFERLLAEVPEDAAWVALADQDDVWHEDKLARLIEMLDAPGATAATCQARLVDAEGNVLGTTDRRPVGLEDLLLRNQVTGSLSVFTPEVVRRALPFPTATTEAIHDHWLAVCAAGLGDVRWCEEQLQDYVQHRANVLGEDTPTSVRSVLDALRRRGTRGYLDGLAVDHWGWRVAMARGLQQAGADGAGLHAGAIRTVASGRFSLRLVRQVLASWRRGGLRTRAAASHILGAWWYAAIGGVVNRDVGAEES